MPVQEEKNLRFPSAAVRFCRRALRPCLLVASLLLPGLLLLVAVQENHAAAVLFQDVNRSGSLRYRSLWVYGARREGIDARAQIAAMAAIREDLRQRYPVAVAQTDAPWAAFAGEQARLGSVRWASANAMRETANSLTQAIEAQAYREEDRATWLMLVGLCGLAAAFTATLLLLFRLHRSEERQKRLTAILDSTTDLISIADSQGAVLYLNHAFRRFLRLGMKEGLTQAGISSVGISGHVAPASYELLTTEGFPTARRDGSWQGETAFLSADGREVPMSQLVLAHSSADGTVVQFSTIARDITSQKQAEEALQAEQARFAAIAAAQSDILGSSLESDALMALIAYKAMALTGATGAVIALNEGTELVCAAACGSSAQALGLRLAMAGSLSGLCAQTGQMQICTDAATDSRTDADACRRLGVVSMLMLPLSQAGAVIGVLNVLSPERSAFTERDGQTLELIAGFVGVALSRAREFEARRVLLEERTASLAAVQESQSLFLASTDAMQEGFAIQDWEGRVLRCNAAAERILGLTASDFVGHLATSHGWAFFHEDGTEFPREQHPTRIALATGEAPPETIFGIQRPGQPTQWLQLQATPLFHVGETRPYAAVQTFSDITARLTAEETLRRSEDRLRRLHDLTTKRGLSSAEKMDALLALGCAFFGLEIGVVTQIAGERYTVLHARSPENCVPAGLTCDTKDTFCAEVFRNDQPLGLAHIGESDRRDLPAYAAFGLEAYLGAPLWVGDQLYGTLCFSSLSPHIPPFNDADREILRLMTRWAGSEIAREEARQQIESYNVVLEFQKGELEKANAELEALATTDGLTAIKNHRAFQQRLEEEATRAQRYGTPLSLVLLDVDRFKQYNDTFGHPEGDVVLKHVAHLLSANARETDLAARYGGEEFVVLLPQTDTAGALVIAERIREAIESFDWPHRAVTASLGIATLTPAMSRGSDLTAAADLALYQSKSTGRNRVTAAAATASPAVLQTA